MAFRHGSPSGQNEDNPGGTRGEVRRSAGGTGLRYYDVRVLRKECPTSPLAEPHGIQGDHLASSNLLQASNGSELACWSSTPLPPV